MKPLLAICLLLLCSGSVMAENKFGGIPVEQKAYLCIAEVAGGLAYNKSTKSWRGAAFNAGQKFIVKIADKEHPAAFMTVTEFGDKSPLFLCENYFCNDIMGRFVFNVGDLRFTHVYPFGYYSSDEYDGSTPYIAGGTCSPL